MRKIAVATLVCSSALTAWALPANADTATYRATFVENQGGPNQPSECAPGTSCGYVVIPGVGSGTSVLAFGACGNGCHVREITFSDGATMTMHEFPQGPFHSEGRAGDHGYIGHGLPGNPQRQEIDQVIVAGTDRLAGVTGEGTGTVKVAGGSTVIKTTGWVDLP